MKSKIALSNYSIVLTTILFLVLFICCVVTVREKPVFFTLLFVSIFLIVCALFHAASYITADSDHIIIGNNLRKHKIIISNIECIELFQPTMGAIKICGSGGFMGYWGIFREGDIGRYQAFYGKASDCFLIRLKNGDKYVLGCENPKAMVDYIKSRINK